MKKIDDIASWIAGHEGECQRELETSPEAQPESPQSKNKAAAEILVTSRPPRIDLLEHQLKLVTGKDWGGEIKTKTDAGGDRLVS